MNKTKNGTEITITRPDDFHLHLRDGDAMKSVLLHSSQDFRRALIMPNLKPPVTTVAQALSYRKQILAAVPLGMNFEPLMTLYLTDNTSPEEIIKARKSGLVPAVKYYPAGATTNSSAGVTDIKKVYPVLEMMEKVGIGLGIHGEVTDPEVDIFDREAVFLDKVLYGLRMNFPGLKIVLEHVTTKEGVGFVLGSGPNIAATITAHHLLENRNAIFRGGLNPHNYCLPVLKREEHRKALLSAATSGSPNFFLGTDSAPHGKRNKESAYGCAGCYTAPIAMELYAEVFDSVGKIDMLESFASHFGADFYGLPRNVSTLTLTKKPFTVPSSYPFGLSYPFGNDGDTLIPFRAGEILQWQVVDN